LPRCPCRANRLQQPASANSLWQAGARTVLQRPARQPRRRHPDGAHRHRRLGQDLQRHQTTRTTGNKTGIPHFFGLESTIAGIMPKAFDPSSMIETNSTTSTPRRRVNRAEKISLTVAAVVTQVLPNGN